MESTSTKIVSEFSPEKVEEFKKFILAKLSKAKKLGSYRRATYYVVGDAHVGIAYVVLVDSEGRVIYFVRHRPIKANGFRLGRQVLVWRDRSSPEAGGFAEYVFFQYLLPKFGALVADQEQTDVGHVFWQNSLRHALEKYQGLHAYFLDRRSTPNRLVDLKTYDDVVTYKNDLWGSSEGHKRTFAVISNKKLTLKTKH